MELDIDQHAAVASSAFGKFRIVCGGAGTGKTTIIKSIYSLVRKGLICSLAGKAAARLREATGLEASTIHRMLQYNGKVFARETLKGHCVIIDEASMVDIHLLAAIVRLSPAQLILVGDVAQLPPVGRGQPFHDLVAMRPEHVSMLKKCYRQTEAIYRAATMVREGEMPPKSLQTPGETWEILPTGDDDKTQECIVDMVRAGDLDFEQDIVIVPKNGDSDQQVCACRALNLAIRDVANPAHNDKRLDVGDRVINTENYADLDVWNGTTGRIHGVDGEGGIWVTTDTPVMSPDGEMVSEVLFDREKVKSLKLGYALTVHKSQGSQYRNVVFAALHRDAWMLDRSLVYTAVTRAKSTCRVVGHPQAFRNAIAKLRPKSTVLQQIIRRGQA